MKKRLLLLISLLVVLSLVFTGDLVVADEIDADNSAIEAIEVRGAGADLWQENIEFHFAYVELEGDADIIARFVYHEDLSGLEIAWNRSGLMLRDGLEAEDPHVSFLHYMAIDTYEIHFQQEKGSGNEATGAGVISSRPDWMRLKREGNLITAYHSLDGEEWEEVGNIEIDLDEKIYIGMAVCSTDAEVLNTAKFTNITVNGEEIQFEEWQNTDVPENLAIPGEISKTIWEE